MCNVADDECAVDAAREQLTVAGEVELTDAGAEVANEGGFGVLVVEDAGGLECAQVPDFHVALARARRQRVLVRIECDRLDGRVVRAQLLDQINILLIYEWKNNQLLHNTTYIDV